LSDDCQEKDEIPDCRLVLLARKIATALSLVQSGEPDEKIVYQHEVLKPMGFEQVGAGKGGYAVYQYNNGSQPVLLHVTPYGPSVAGVLPFYVVLEYESSKDLRVTKWSNSLQAITSMEYLGGQPQVVEGYCYQGAYFSPFHFAELKTMYDKQLLAYEYACKKLPIVARTTQSGVVPNDLPTLKAFLERGKRNRKRKQNIRSVSHSCLLNSNAYQI